MAPKGTLRDRPSDAVLLQEYGSISDQMMGYFSELLHDRIAHHGQAIMDHILAMGSQPILL